MPNSVIRDQLYYLRTGRGPVCWSEALVSVCTSSSEEFHFLCTFFQLDGGRH